MMSDSTLDLRIRLFSDGGPLYGLLNDIENGSARNSRAVQLMYLGLMVEAGRFVSNGGDEKPATKTAAIVQFAPTQVTKTEPATPDFLPDDLAATFG